jgi:tRNA U34 5-carboxymethylaminomethyl modifying GTPase MnmE/TrmE
MTTDQQVLQVVSGDGEFNEADVRHFVSAAHIDTAGVDYQTIAITGPQSSGKSTLMNALVSFVRHCMISRLYSEIHATLQGNCWTDQTVACSACSVQ